MPKGIPNNQKVTLNPQVDPEPTVDEPQDVPGLNPIAIEAMASAADAFVAEENTSDEPGLFVDVPVETVPFLNIEMNDTPMIVDYAPAEIRWQDAFYLRQRAAQWREEIAYEQLKAAANSTTILAMTWAANQLEQMADAILLFPLSREVIPEPPSA